MASNAGKLLAPGSCTFGADPELFLSRGGRVIGSEVVVPEGGLISSYGKVVRDGVQVELQPISNHCRQSFASYLSSTVQTLNQLLQKTDITIDFRAVVDVDEEEFTKLSEDSRRLGCAPSLNHYDVTASVYNPPGFRTRSAGGHLHFGLLEGHTSLSAARASHDAAQETYKKQYEAYAKQYGESWCQLNYPYKGNVPFDEGLILAYAYAFKNRERIVPILDVLVGNTAVLLDREPRAAERRQTYGRAGEYRLPDHGLEYRTLSNFWMASYEIYSLILAMARQAIGVICTESIKHAGKGNEWDAASELLKLVDLNKVRQAIDQNDVVLAWDNFEGVKKFLHDHTNATKHTSGLLKEHIPGFEWMARTIQKDGMQSLFKQTPLELWGTYRDWTALRGWEKYWANTLAKEVPVSTSVTLSI